MNKELGIIASLLAVVGSTLHASAQGTVNFANASTTSGLPPGNRNVVWGIPEGPIQQGGNVSSNYAGLNFSSLRVQLYSGTGVDVSTWTPVAGTLSTFKQSTSTTAGSWFNKTGTIVPGAPGATVNLAVVVWESNLDAANPFSPAAQGGWWGQSPIFQYTITASGTPAPSEFLMLNFQGMTIYPGPEPSSLALTFLGLTALAIHRRRRKLTP